MTELDVSEQLPPSEAKNKLVRWAALSIGVAGLIHLIIVPEHWAHAPAHALFFVLAGIAEIAWGIAVWRRPSAILYHIGLVGTGALLVLWGITRLLPAPFGHGPEAVDGYSIVCKISEGLGMVALLILAFQAASSRAGRLAGWRAISLFIVAALLAGFLLQGVARAAEPLFPSLGPPAEQHHEHEAAPDAGHLHEHELTPSPEHLHEE
jgi:hypothetical protein